METVQSTALWPSTNPPPHDTGVTEVRVAVLGWDSGGGCARILGKGGNLLRECGGARGFYLHVKHFSWISSVAVSPVYRPAHPRVQPGQTVRWRQPPHISSQVGSTHILSRLAPYFGL